GVPVHVATSGKLLLSSGGFANFANRAALTVEGAVEVESGSRLRFDDVGPARDLLVKSGASLIGDGVLQLDGSNRIVMAGDSSAVLKVVLNGARMTGGATLGISGAQTLTGTYDGPVRVQSGAQVFIQDAVFNNHFTIDSGAAVE